MDARRLRALYSEAYEDPESFEEVSSAISNTINQLAAAVEPEVSGDDLDGVIQAIMKVVEEKAKETAEARNKPSQMATKRDKFHRKVSTKKSKK